MDPHVTLTPIATKLPILDTGKFEQWKFRIQQYLQHEHYTLWEVIEFASTKKKGRTLAVTAEDMQKRKNDVKARTTLLLALPDEHQLRFSKYEIAKELWEAILKIFGGNEATKKTKKNQLKQQYGNFKDEGSETLEQTFNRLNDLDEMGLDDLYSHLKVYELEIQKKTWSSSQNMAFISSPSNNSGKGEVSTVIVQAASSHVTTTNPEVTTASFSHDIIYAYIATQSNGSQIRYEDITQINEDDMEEMDIKWNMALLSMRADRFWKRTGKKITIQGSDVAGFDKSEVECFNCHKMGHFARECRAPRSQDKGRRESYKKDPKVEEPGHKAMMAFDESGWDWSYMAEEEEDHALVAEEEEAPTEFALMAKYSSSSDNEKIRVLESDVEIRNNKIESLSNELEALKKEKEGIDFKIKSFSNASKHLDDLLGNTRPGKDKIGMGFNEYTAVAPLPGQVYSSPVKDLSWIGLPKFVDNTVTDYTRPTPSVNVSNSVVSEQEGNDSSIFEQGGTSSNAMKMPLIQFVKGSANCGIWVEKGETWPRAKYKNMTPRAVLLKTGTKPTALKRPVSIVRPTLNVGKPQDNIDNKGFWDSGCSRHMTGNISYLSNFMPYDGGYVSFGDGGGKITGKGTIKPGKLEFENVDFKLDDDRHVLLRTPRQQNMYAVDLKNIVPHENLSCLIAKASVDESMLWHRRLGHLNFKTMNKLVRNNLVTGLPSKIFKNDHSCVDCLKGKQHRASCKSKLVNSISKPLHTLHMDLFGPTSISSLNHKWYCLVVTNDFSMFTWTFFLKTKDETFRILRNFITEIENIKDLKVKIIRCDNRGEFRNKDMDDFCSKKGIKREFSNARTPQQNGVAERRNRTLVEAARTMLADAKLPVTFWTEAVNTACYVQNRVLVIKTHSKTPYELFNGRAHAIGFLRPFGGHVMILNTLDHLGMFDAKGDEGFFVGYSLSSKAFRVYNKRTRHIEENLHIDFLEGKAIDKGAGPNWLFDIESLTKSMNYVPVVVAGTSSTNISGTIKDIQVAMKEMESPLRFLALTNWFHEAHEATSNVAVEKEVNGEVSKSSGNSLPIASKDILSNESFKPPSSPTVETTIPTASLAIPTVIKSSLTEVEADLSNMETDIQVSPTPTFRINKDHPKNQIIGPIDTPVQTRNKAKSMEEQSFIAIIHQKTNPDLLQLCLFSCFLSQVEPKKIINALKDES
ncbi:putative ribonuclease H-like domain-containing protein [Tanacetum coccineum]|uniref:Ribonuclease H-like domain-containing protein n=1 Tax=Tanacetum coccineum TaxID=301880 RepID=A0ABQ5B5J2_9ASTR